MLTYSMGGPSIDSGAYYPGHDSIIRYTPPCPEFEVLMLTIDPGETLEMENPDVPTILLVLEGSGMLHGQMLRPGRAYYWPKETAPLKFEVAQSRRGPLKIAMAHENRHILFPTTVNRDDFGHSSHQRVTMPGSPMPYMGLGREGHSPSHLSRKELDFDDHQVPSLT